MKQIIFLFIFLCGSTFSFSQEKLSYVNDYVKLDTVLFFPEESGSDFQAVYCLWKNTLVFTNYNIYLKTDTIKVYFYDIQNHETYNKYLFYPGLYSWMEENASISFSFLAYNTSHICLGLFNQVLVFKKENNEFIFNKKIKVEKSISYGSFLDNKTLFFLSLKNNQQPPVSLLTYDIESGKRIKEINPTFQHPLLSYFQPNHLIDVKNGEILFSHRRDYASIIYNSKLDSINHIEAHHLDWIRMKDKSIDRINRNYPKEEAMSIIEEVEKHLPSIHQQVWTYFINENKVACIYISPYEKNETPVSKMDIWERSEGKFVLKKEGIIDFLGIRSYNDTIDKHSFGLSFLSGHQYLFTDNQIIVFRKYASDINPIGLSMSDYQEQHKNYFLKKNPILSIYIYSHNF